MYWYEEDVKSTEQEAQKLTYKPQMVFYGSSSIRLWDSLYKDFADFKPVNLGFGGSTLEACVFFFERMMQPYQDAKQLVIYAGDNDLGDGKQPEEVLNHFTQLCEKIKSFFNPEIEVFYLSIKASVARWDIHDKIQETNSLIESTVQQQFPTIHFINIYDSMIDENGMPLADLFVEDGLHMSAKGYDIWTEILLHSFASAISDTQ